MLIRNFTQEGGTDRGAVTVGKPNNATATSTPVVLTAAIVGPMSATEEVINDVVIAGPADVTISCGSDATGNCFISYKKVDNE
jgi:hypothetical protein